MKRTIGFGLMLFCLVISACGSKHSENTQSSKENEQESSEVRSLTPDNTSNALSESASSQVSSSAIAGFNGQVKGQTFYYVDYYLVNVVGEAPADANPTAEAKARYEGSTMVFKNDNTYSWGEIGGITIDGSFTQTDNKITIAQMVVRRGSTILQEDPEDTANKLNFTLDGVTYEIVMGGGGMSQKNEQGEDIYAYRYEYHVKYSLNKY